MTFFNRKLSIRIISMYGLTTLIAGSLLSGGILLYFLFMIESIKEEQSQISSAYDTVYKLTHVTERLLTTYRLQEVRAEMLQTRDRFEDLMLAVDWFDIEQKQALMDLWVVVSRELANVDKQLDKPIFTLQNMQDKSLLRRLGEGLHTDTQYSSYLWMSELFNSIELLKQYEAFLLDELTQLRTQEEGELNEQLSNTKKFALLLPSLIMFSTLAFMFYIARLIGKNEEDLIESQHDLQLTLDKFEYLFNTTLESIFLLEENRCVDVNAKVIDMFGFTSKSDITGKDISDVIAKGSRRDFDQSFSQGYNEPFETVALKHDGSEFPVLCRSFSFTSEGHQLQIVTVLDLSEIKEKDAQLRQTVRELREKQDVLDYQAHYDLLTSLPNRLLFLDRFQHAIQKAKRHKTKVVLLFIDLDRFKEINDSLGHSVGDRVLELVASRLKKVVREEDTVARLGGDEFTLLLEDVTSVDAVHQIASKIITRLQEPMFLDNHELYVTTSIGISSYPDDGQTPEALLRNADAAMYKAKAEGKNNYQFYTEDMTQQAYQRISMERKIRRGLDEDIFELHYQPQVDSTSGKIVATEALLRWPQGDGTMIPPDKFIPLAEETGLIISIGEWVLKQACEQVCTWKELGYKTGRMAINISGKQLQHDGFYEMLVETLDATGCRPEWIELEVTESFVMKDPHHSIGLLQKIRDLGMEIAIDDFGTGYSSMTYLKKLPINTLKIDRSFIMDIPDDSEDVAITQAVIALAKGMGMKLVAEGVETDEQKEFLVREGCTTIQGYYYYKPLHAEEVKNLF